MRRASTLVVLATFPSLLVAQPLPRQPGHLIGKVTTIGRLIHLELDSAAIAPERLFDLDHRTLRFIPDGPGYRIENIPLVWDADFGPALTAPTAALTRFKFPFSGKNWDTLNVAIGSITFGALQDGRGGGRGGPPAGNRTGAGGSARAGFQMERYAVLETVGRTFINMIPGIAAFTRVGSNGQRYLKELADRVVVTWTLSEGAGGIQAFSWTPTVNRIQAVLHKNGVIELSYNDVNAKDAVVGVFPTVTAGVEKALASIPDADDPAVAPNLDVKTVTLSAIDGLYLKATIETRGPIVPEDLSIAQQSVGTQPVTASESARDPGINGLTYRIAFHKTNSAATDLSKPAVLWTIRGFAGGRGFGGGRGRGGFQSRYIASGDGVEPDVTVSGNAISVRGILPLELSGVTRVSVSADAGSSPTSIVDPVPARPVELKDIRSPEIDLSSATKKAGPFSVAYEGFHWPEIPRATDVACSIIRALGDNFDFIVSYSDFRVDNPEGGTPSTGPRGGNVSGVGTSTNGLENYCSNGQLQWMYAQPVSMAAVQSQERSPDGRMTDYNYAMSQVGHELGHRWAANARAIVNGDTIVLGPTHWAAGLHLPAAFPYSNPRESDAMGGSTWKDNGDGTWTQLDRDYYSPAKGWSWFALYLMGLARPDEVQPFFILRNLQRTGQTDAEGHPIYKGDKTIITLQDVIGAMGPRLPDFDHSQKTFNTAMVVVTMHGKQPSKELITAANNIADHWIVYWSKTTGGRASMTVSPTTVAAPSIDRKALWLDPSNPEWRTPAPPVSHLRFETSKGVFVLRLMREWGPIGADRFYNLARLGYYDDARFHRVNPNYIVQFGLHGDPAVNAAWKNQYLADDPPRSMNARGTFAFAMKGQPNTRDTQIYINLADNSRNNAEAFTVLGTVIEGMAVIDSLYSGYGETSGAGMRQGRQGPLESGGNAYMDREFPLLDRILRVSVSPGR